MTLRRKARTAGALVVQSCRDARRRRAIARAPRPTAGVRVYYGIDDLPSPDRPLSGGLVKFQRLAETVPNERRSFNVLYLGSSSRPRDTRQLIRLARARGAAVVWNQNGVAYPAWHGPGWERTNRRLAESLHSADYVIFQSEFCRLSSDLFLGECTTRSEVLYNPVDTNLYRPAPRSDRPLTLLLGGNQYRWYRVEVALRVLAELMGRGSDARLLVTGALGYDGDALRARQRLLACVLELGVEDRVELLGTYTQVEAPAVLARADILLHTQFNDASPGVVVEALACGLPVAYSASGGVPELVGAEAGVGVEAPIDFEVEHPPSARDLAEAVLEIVSDYDTRREAARRRAVERFDLEPWARRHSELFRSLAR